MRLLRVLAFLLLWVSVLQTPVAVFAQEEDSAYQEKLKEIEELKQKLSAAQGQSKTLSDAIAILNSKKALTQKQIEATQFQITFLQKDIDSLTGKIDLLEGSLNSLTSSLLQNIQASYKHRNIQDIDVLFSSGGFSDLFTRHRYLVTTQQYRQDLLLKTTQAKFEYDQEKDRKEKKQAEITELKSKYQKQQADLISQERAKQLLLTQTRNDEAMYQRLLSQATAELSALRGFTSSKAGGALPPQNSPDGWYYSQRDERWAGMCIGNSCGTKNQGNIMEVGCLIADVAMIKKKFGEDVTPASIAANPGYFFSTTAYMLQPWPAPGGYRYERFSGYNKDKLDAELREGRPVIVHLRVNTRDGHFIVIKSGENGNYTMHDPWEGYDKKFSDFYSTSQISNINVLKKV